ncbi:hypothetical protein DOM21_07180 [Bacteriovorax stolpii]|uniref:hypothetical protein n=1 Tax=Bacteriovorax stolpii TaxID=960 RepID=UPI00115B1463|nr:hypothetical protein [Bacteriovorax stolpii]QDK41242.1 hypothetical protein DOM21_07180 [Bacteriovorax stolpii]
MIIEYFITVFQNSNFWDAFVGLGSMIAAFLSYVLYRRSEAKNRPIPNAEAEMDGGIRHIEDDSSNPKKQFLLIPIKVRIWNEGYVDSAIKNILILDKYGFSVDTLDRSCGHQELVASLSAGQIQDFEFWLNLGPCLELLENTNISFFPRDDLRMNVSEKTQEKFQELRIIIELTNHPDLIGHLPNPFFGSPKADPVYPHNPDRSLFRKIPFRIVENGDFEELK